jgi:Tfp pilus assembly protein PilV
VLLELNKILNLLICRKKCQQGQSLLELVVGIGMVTVVVGAIAVISLSSLRNTQFSKNQIQATKLAQQNIELVRTIKNSNFGVCTQYSQTAGAGTCSTWQDIWNVNFGTYSDTTNTCSGAIPYCTFNIIYSCTALVAAGVTETKPICLNYSATRAATGVNFTSSVIIEDEAAGQKKVTSRVYWTDTTGEHSSNLVTILSKY